jgi:hypothetical protein
MVRGGKVFLFLMDVEFISSSESYITVFAFESLDAGMLGVQVGLDMTRSGERRMVAE